MTLLRKLSGPNKLPIFFFFLDKVWLEKWNQKFIRACNTPEKRKWCGQIFNVILAHTLFSLRNLLRLEQAWHKIFLTCNLMRFEGKFNFEFLHCVPVYILVIVGVKESSVFFTRRQIRSRNRANKMRFRNKDIGNLFKKLHYFLNVKYSWFETSITVCWLKDFWPKIYREKRKTN
jgi:hypothetical protein